MGLDPDHGWRNEQVLQLILDRPAEHRVGTKFHNSNSHYVLLGLVIERLEGPGLERSFQKRIFDPLGMKDTHFGYFPRPRELARGYDDPRGTGQYEDVTEYDVGDRLADGGVVSTAADLAKFMRGLFADLALLGPRALKRMTVEDAIFTEGALYGYGIVSRRTERFGTEIGAEGTYFGYQSEVTYYPSFDTVVVALANARRQQNHAFVERIAPLLFTAGAEVQ